jgi:hypothetical protein
MLEKYLRDPQSYDLKPGFEKFNGVLQLWTMDRVVIAGSTCRAMRMIRPVFENLDGTLDNLDCSTVTIRILAARPPVVRCSWPSGLSSYQDEIEYGRGYHNLMDT